MGQFDWNQFKPVQPVQPSVQFNKPTPFSWDQFKPVEQVPGPPKLPELKSWSPNLPKTQPTVDPGFTPFAPSFKPIRQAIGKAVGVPASNFISGALSGPFAEDEVAATTPGKLGMVAGSIGDVAAFTKGGIAGAKWIGSKLKPIQTAAELKAVPRLISLAVDKGIPEAIEAPIKITPIEKGWQVGEAGEKLPLPAKLETSKEIPKLESPTKPPITIPKQEPAQPRDVLFDWNNRRGAGSDFSGQTVKEKFARLDAEGFAAIPKIEAGEKGYEDVRSYLDEAYKRAKSLFDDIGYRQNYLPLLFKNSKEEVAKAFEGTHVSTKPGFTLKRTLEDYQQGIDAGLTPKFDKVSDILGWYEQALVRAGEDKKLYSYLRENKLLSTKKKEGWEYLDPDLFPRVVAKGQGRVLYAPKQIAKDINNIIRPNEGILAKAAKVMGFSKSMVLTGGVPGTGLNWHGTVNIPWRAATSDGIKAAVKTYLYDFRPSMAEKFLQGNREKMVDAANHGLTLGAEGFWAGQEKNVRNTADLTVSKLTNTGRKFLNAADTFEGWFADPLFKKVIPAVKVESWDKVWQSYAKAGLPTKEAKMKAAEFVNHSYGGANNPFIKKDIRNLSQVFFLAPDWLETKYQLGKGALKFLKDPTSPVGEKYAKTVAKMAVLLATTNGMRRIISGKDAPTSGRVGNVPIPPLDQPGKKAEADPFGAAFDTVELPMRMANEIRKGANPLVPLERFGRSNLSTGGQFIYNQIAGEDILGRPTRGVDRFGRKVPNNELVKNVLSEVINLWLPQNIQAPIDYGIGRITGPEATSQALEVPIRWYRNPRP